MPAGDPDIVHGMLIGLAVFIALATGLLLTRTTLVWLNDDRQAQRLALSRLHRGPWLVVAGVVIAAVAVLLFPATAVIPAGPGDATSALTASAPGNGTVSAPMQPNAIDQIGLGLILGVVAGATPFLISVDVLVRRLPDRIVYPLIAACLVIVVSASVFGESHIWFFGLFAGLGAALLFGLLHLIGRALHARTMGLGDVKLAFVVFTIAGLFNPWAPFLVLIATMLIAGFQALIAASRQRRLRGVTIAFGPAMLSGMWLGSVLAPFLL